MTHSVWRGSFFLMLVCMAAVTVHAGPAASVAGTSVQSDAATTAPSAEPEPEPDEEPDSRRARRHANRHHANHGSNIVSIGHDSTLPAGEHAESVVSILGSSTSDGDATDVVSILGNTRVTGPVRDTAVAVVGNTYIDSKVDGDVVAVVGNVELGPHAEIGGDVVAVLGSMRRDPAAVIHGAVQNILSVDFGRFEWLHAWLSHCLLYGRPLAPVSELGWAWCLALGFLALYVFLALLCRPAISRCVQTFETHPGQSLLAAILAMLLSPVLIVLLCVTVIGIAAVPFFVTAVFGAVLFGKAAMLAWVGGRITGHPVAGALAHPAVAVLVGGIIVLVLYVVPVLGFLVYNLLGVLGLGVVVYSLILAARSRQAVKLDPIRTPAGAAPAASAAPAQAPSSQTSTADSPPPPPPPPPPPHAAAPPVTASMPRAGFWIRMAALLLDVLLVGFVMSVLHDSSHLHLLALGAYGAIMWKLRGSTVGGIVFDLKVVRLDGREVDWETAIVRALGCFLSLAVAGLGFIWIAFDASAQAWHDKIAGTVVVRVPKGVPLV